MYQHIFFFLLLTSTSLTAPMDDPIRVDLPIYKLQESGSQQQASDITLNQPLQPENHPATQNKPKESDFDKAVFSKGKDDTKQSLSVGGIFHAQPITREDALQEMEGWGSKTLSIKENIQNVVAGVFQPKPLVDTISEEDKYGNTGDKFAGIGRAVVGGAESVSNLVNSVLEVPGKIFRQVTKLATEKLNNLGGKLIGL